MESFESNFRELKKPLYECSGTNSLKISILYLNALDSFWNLSGRSVTLVLKPKTDDTGRWYLQIIGFTMEKNLKGT